MNEYFIDTGEYLEHYGVKGQRWGVRRNKNKTRISRRQKRYNKMPIEKKVNKANYYQNYRDSWKAFNAPTYINPTTHRETKNIPMLMLKYGAYPVYKIGAHQFNSRGRKFLELAEQDESIASVPINRVFIYNGAEYRTKGKRFYTKESAS